MKVQYDKNEDILMIQLAKKKIDHAYETGSMIVHVTEDKEPVLLEIFEAKKFFALESKTLPRQIKEQYFAI